MQSFFLQFVLQSNFRIDFFLQLNLLFKKKNYLHRASKFLSSSHETPKIELNIIYSSNVFIKRKHIFFLNSKMDCYVLRHFRGCPLFLLTLMTMMMMIDYQHHSHFSYSILMLWFLWPMIKVRYQMCLFFWKVFFPNGKRNFRRRFLSSSSMLDESVELSSNCCCCCWCWCWDSINFCCWLWSLIWFDW